MTSLETEARKERTTAVLGCASNHRRAVARQDPNASCGLTRDLVRGSKASNPARGMPIARSFRYDRAGPRSLRRPDLARLGARPFQLRKLPG